MGFLSGLVLTSVSAESYTAQFLMNAIASWLPVLTVFLILRQLGWLDKLVFAIAARTWPWRGILHHIALVRFLCALAMLLEAGLGVPQAIERAAAVTVHPRVRAALVAAVPLVQQGVDLAKALQTTGMLPGLAVEMVHAGEHSGRLEELLRKCAQYIEEGTSHDVKMLQFTFFALLIPAVLAAIVLQGIAAGAIAVFVSLRNLFGP